MRTSIRLALVLGFLGLAIGVGRAQDNNPILSLDPGGHTAQVDQVLFTPDGKGLISVGEDKAVRVWNADTGEMLRTFRGQIGDGPDGKIYAAALTPDGQTLAVGGYLRGSDGTTFYIRLLDTNTGHVKRLISGLSDPTYSLAFSPDGNTLVCGVGAGVVRVCDARSGKSYSLTGHAKDVYGVALSPKGDQIASASLDGTVRLWRVGSQKSRVLDGKVLSGYRCVAWSPDGRWIAAGGFDRKIHIWDASTGSPWLTLLEEKYINCIAFSPNSTLLAAGLGSDKPDLCDVRLWAIGPDGPVQKPVGGFTHHSATVQAVAFAPDSQSLASAGGLANDIYLWGDSGADVKHHLVSRGGATQDVAWSPDSTRVTWKNQTSGGTAQHTFNLADHSLIPNPDEVWDGATLSQGGSTLSKGDDGASVRISSGGRIRLKGPDQVNSFTWTPSGEIAVGSTFGLSLYDRAGHFEHAFIGHTGDVLSVSVSPDHKYLASASGDQTVRIWPLDPAAVTDSGSVLPLMSLFVGEDQEWVAWTHHGYYTCSSNGENIMGWQINRGDAEAADFYPASRFHRRFFRDDILGHLLAAGGEENAIALADKGRSVKTDLTADNLAQLAPPTVEIVDPADRVKIADANVTLKVHITDPNNRPLGKLTLTDDGIAVPPPVGGLPTPQAGDMTLTAALHPGDNTLTVLVSNDAGIQSVPATIKITHGSSDIPKVGTPALYILSIGVSNYLDHSLECKGATTDAQNIADLFKSQQGTGKMFSRVEVTELCDKKAHREDVINSLIAFRKQAMHMGPNDYTIVFVAGHGFSDDLDHYFFAPYDVNLDSLEASGVSWEYFSGNLAPLLGTVILMLDTCHSAGVKGKIDDRDGYGRFLIASTSNVYNGASRVITFASCGTGQESQGGQDGKNGVFTRALIDGLSGAADADHNGVVTVNELSDYVKQQVRELTKEAQIPELNKPSFISGDLPLSVVGPVVSHTAISISPAVAVMAKAP